MAFVITIAQQKGGAGKTTLACHLTAALLGHGSGCRVATIDLDPQQSLSFWAEQREARTPSNGHYGHVPAPGYRGLAAISRLAYAVDVLIMDTPPHDEATTQQAVRRADLVLVPMQLTPFDLMATKNTLKMIRTAGRPFLLVYNRVPTRSRIAEVIRERLKEYNAPAANTELGLRTAFAASVLVGQGVTEAAPSSRAAAEILVLMQEIMEHSSNVSTRAVAA